MIKVALQQEELASLSSEELRQIASDNRNSDTTRRLAGRELSERVNRLVK